MCLRIAGVCLGIILAVPAAYANSGLFLNRIEGQIFDESNNPIGELYVVLESDAGSTLKTQRATPQGRFTFFGLTAGSYRVRVLPSGRNFLEQSKDVQFIPSISGRSDETQFVEFYMRVDKRAAQLNNELSSPEVVYAQDVPDAARKLYKSGIDRLDRADYKGLEDLQAAIDAFPTYFAALSRLGKEYVQRKDYRKAYPLLIRAIDVNQRSYSSYYALAFSFYSLNELPAAIKAAEACTVIQPEAVDGHVLLGMILRIHGDLADSEKSLRKAIALSKGQNALAHWQLALLLNRLNRNNEAADEVEAYLNIGPHDEADIKAARDLINKLRAAKPRS